MLCSHSSLTTNQCAAHSSLTPSYSLCILVRPPPSILEVVVVVVVLSKVPRRGSGAGSQLFYNYPAAACMPGVGAAV